MDLLFVPRYKSNSLFVIFLVLFVVLIVDISISNVSDIITDKLVSPSGIILFIGIFGIYVIGLYYILRLIKLKNRESNIKPSTDRINTMTSAIQYILLIVFGYIILQIIIFSYYYSQLLTICVTLSYSLTAFLMTMLAQKLFSWFKIEKNLVVLLYGLMASVMALNAIASILLFDVVLISKPLLVTPQSPVIFEVGFPPENPMSWIATLQSTSLVAFFLLTWAATSVLMRHYMARIGKIKYWVLVSAPLIYFMSYYFTFYQQLNPTNPFQAGPALMFPILMETYAIALCGILFGMGFRSVSRSMEGPSHARDYMVITALGFILFFNAEDATVLQASFPPYGLVNVVFVGIAAYLIFTGLHYSAISVANDINLRKSIKKAVAGSSKLLDNIATAQARLDMEKRVMRLTREKAELIEEQTGIHTSLTDKEITTYMRKVLDETHKDTK